MTDLVELALLRTFRAILEARSVTLAAERLGLTQSAVSKQLAALERRFGRRLVHRDGRGVLPTAAGALLARMADRALSDLDSLRTGGGEGAGREVVRLGLSPTVAELIVVPLLAEIATGLPEVSLAVSDGFSGHVAEWLRAGTIEVGVLYGTSDLRGLRIVATFAEPLHLVLHAASPIPADGLRPEHLAALTYVLPGAPHGLRLTVEALFRSYGLPLRVGYEIASFATMRRLVREGVAATILPRHSVAEDLRAGAVLSPPVAGMPMTRTLVLAAAPGTEGRAAVDAVAAAVAALLDRGLGRSSDPREP